MTDNEIIDRYGLQSLDDAALAVSKMKDGSERIAYMQNKFGVDGVRILGTELMAVLQRHHNMVSELPYSKKARPPN